MLRSYNHLNQYQIGFYTLTSVTNSQQKVQKHFLMLKSKNTSVQTWFIEQFSKFISTTNSFHSQVPAHVSALNTTVGGLGHMSGVDVCFRWADCRWRAVSSTAAARTVWDQETLTVDGVSSSTSKERTAPALLLLQQNNSFISHFKMHPVTVCAMVKALREVNSIDCLLSSTYEGVRLK